MARKAQSQTGRRANGEGWVFKDGDKYRVKLAVGTDPSTGKIKYRSVRAASHAEALKKLRELQSSLLQGKLTPSSKGNFGTFLEDWLVKHIQPNRTQNTYRQYRWLVDDHITPHLGKKRLEDVRRADVKELIALKAKQVVSAQSERSTVPTKLLSRSTLRLIRAVLHAAFADAIKDGLIALNPASHVELPKGASTEVVFLKPEEAAKLYMAAIEDELAEFWVFMLSTGVRIGEATGVRWIDFDLETGIVQIRGQLQRSEGVLQYVESTKTNQDRKLALTEELCLRLKNLRSRYLIDDFEDPDQIAFLNPLGRRLDPKYVRNKLEVLCRKAGVPVVSPHKLRHTAATLALAETGDLHAVQKLLGHSQIALTANVYGHAVDKSQRRLADAIQKALETRE